MGTDKLATGDSGSKVTDLHAQLQSQGLTVSPEEVKRSLFGPSTTQAVTTLQKQNGLPPTGVVDQATAATLSTNVIKATLPTGGIAGTTAAVPGPGTAAPAPSAAPSAPPPTNGSSPGGAGVTGSLYMDYGIPADSVKLRLYSKGFGGSDTLVGNGSSDATGKYQLSYDPAKTNPSNLEVRALDAGGKEYVISAPFVNAGDSANQGMLNLIAPSDVKPIGGSEFARLGTDVTAVLGSFLKIGEAKEQGETQDISYLNNSTNWDARILALAAHSATVSQSAGISHEALYAMMRAGLPNDPNELAHVAPSDVKRALDAAVDKGIVSLDDGQKNAALTAFQSFSANTRLMTKEVSAVSPYSDFLKVHNLPADKQTAFVTAYFAPRKTGAELWQNLKTAGIPDDTIRSMQVQGKLGFLTGNNAPLTQDLQTIIGAGGDLAVLVEKGFYEPAAFDVRLKVLAATTDDNADAINKLIPPAFIGGSVAERKQAYIQDMADKVRTAYPMKVLRSRVDSGIIPFGSDAVKTGVSDFLARSEALNFSLGTTHLDSFVSSNRQTLFQAASVEQQASTVGGLKLLQRVYQVSPNDESMQALFDMGMGSASEVARIPREHFMNDFQKKYLAKFPNTAAFKVGELGTLVYNKSSQVTTTTYNFYSIVQQTQQTSAVFAISGDSDKQKADQTQFAEKISGFPTLQQLFGSLDYCENQDCGSVLSPAAYLVSLLQFLDTKDKEWQYVVDQWETSHPGQTYAAKYSKPYDALIDRRPDIINLPLTCENTDTALPYIDIVNEILEYYLVNKKLSADVAHDTGIATTAELLAEPQNVEPKAYGILKRSVYPLSLPFDLWLEIVRSFCGQYDISLAGLMNIFRPVGADDLDMQRKINLESINISPAEYMLFAAPDILSGLSGLYGYPDDPALLADLRLARQLANRLGVTYKELVVLLRTKFMNPRIDELVLLHKLEVSAYDVVRLKKSPGFAPFSDIDLEAFTEKMAQFGKLYGIDVNAEIDKAWNDQVFLQALLLNDPGNSCNFDQTTIGYPDRGPLKFDYLKLNLFVRLWRKLGWEITEVDRALDVFIPSNLRTIVHDPSKTEADRAKALATGLSTALVNIAHLQSLSSHISAGKQAIVKLSCFWSDIPASGSDSLYARLFLTRNVLKIDPVFDDALGRYLSANVMIIGSEQDHTVALQAALNLTAADIGLILRDNNQDIGSATLSMNNVSLLYRYGLLARGIKLSIPDMILLKQLSGLDPFALLPADEIKNIADDRLMNQLQGFVLLAEKIKRSGFSLEDINYLCRHSYDTTGKYRNAEGQAASTANALKESVRTIVDKYRIPADASSPALFAGYTDDVLQTQLALVLGPVELRAFMAMWTGSVPKSWDAVKTGLGAFLNMDQFNSLFVADPSGADDATIQKNILNKRATLVLALFPYLQNQLIVQSVMGILAGATGAGMDRISWLITDAAHLHDPSNLALIKTFAQAADDGKTAAVQNAVALISKVQQIAGGFVLSDAELEYFISNPADFDNPDLSTLPVKPDIAAGAGQPLFKFLMRIADYVELREDLTGGGDDLIALFKNARLRYDAGMGMTAARTAHLSTLFGLLANLTRRDVEIVRSVAGRLGIDVTTQTANGAILVIAPAFADERGLSKLWNALKLVQLFGVPAGLLVDTIKITDATQADEKCQAIAQNLKNAIKSRYEPEDWQQVAQPIYDTLRKKQRDALVAYHLHNFGNLFSTIEEMYEYFLIDPGTEPVVQTSRIRMATASVQLFVQRCLLNLENRWDKKVPPGVINADFWTWMNRYRLWEANMKIFLWPENWLEPEWRDDKTNMFGEVEGKLLQGDVSADIVEDAFLGYLQKLEAIARLDIVALYIEENKTTPGSNKLHVIGRSFGQPHAYYYRTYAQEMWTPWQPVDAEIDGDHIVAIMWRGRFHLFWVTFVQRVPPETKPVPTSAGAGSTLGNWNVGEALSAVTSGANHKILEAHLHYSEYYQGAWSTKKSAGTDYPLSFQVPGTASPLDISIYATKEDSNPIDSTLDGAVLINLHYNAVVPTGLEFLLIGATPAPQTQSFRVINKNTPPSVKNSGAAPTNWPFVYDKVLINRLDRPSGGNLQVQVPISTTINGSFVSVPPKVQSILGSSQGQFSLLPCGDVSSIGNEDGLGPFVTPFFYQDDWHTFYVEPTLTQTVTTTDWDEWVGGPHLIYSPQARLPDLIHLDPVVTWPIKLGPPDIHSIPDLSDGRLTVSPKVRLDQITAPGTYVKYGERLIGQNSGLNVIATSPQTNQKIIVTDSQQLNNVLAGASSLGKVQFVAAAASDKALVAEPLSSVKFAGAATNFAAPAVIIGSAGLKAGIVTAPAVHFNGVFNR